jgi:AraC-like DNA-binding protein
MAHAFPFSSSLDPPEPARALIPHMLRAAAELGPLPRWVERYPLTAMSPDARQLAWAVGRRITGSPDHGFHIAARVPAEGVGSLWTLYRAAPSLSAIHARYPQFSALLLDCMLPHFELSAHTVRLHLQRGPLRSADRAEEDFRAALQVKTWRALLERPEFAPSAVHFTYPRPRSTVVHEQMLGPCALRFAQPEFGFELPRSAWEEPLPHADPARFEQLCMAACEQVRALREAQPSVEDRVIERLAQGPTAKSVAFALGMSERTLRRRLAQAGDSFRKVVERVRQRESELLDGVREVGGAHAISSREQARLLGFANPGALRNALRRPRKSGAQGE